MKNFFRTRHRIVRDRYLGYEVRFRYWWMPFYLQKDFCNTFSTIKAAEDFANQHKIVKQL